MKNFINPWAVGNTKWNSKTDNRWTDGSSSTNNIIVEEVPPPKLLEGYWAVKEGDKFQKISYLNYEAEPYIIIKTLNIPESTLVTIYIYDWDSWYDADDFNDGSNQPLGFWNPATDYVGGNFIKGFSISNDSYNDWQKTNHKGMNFTTFSDIEYYNVFQTFETNLNI
jgi:hypothetical protein